MKAIEEYSRLHRSANNIKKFPSDHELESWLGGLCKLSHHYARWEMLI